MRDFKPPKDSPLVISLMRLFFPFFLKLKHPGMRFEMSEVALGRFLDLKGKRTIVCLNHSSHDDAEMLFGLAGIVKEEFNVLTARELFQKHFGLDGIWLQSLGCYSVERGLPDFHAYKKTIQLLVAGQKKIVIMPEGEISHHSDLLLSLEAGAARMGLAALAELRGKGLADSVYILPCAARYRYKGDVQKDLLNAVRRLERHFGLKADNALPLTERLSLLCQSLVERLEKKYKIESEDKSNLPARVNNLRKAILKATANFLSFELPKETSQLRACHILHNVLYERRGKAPRRFPFFRKENDASLRKCSRDIWRVVNLLALDGNYPGENSTQEQLHDLVSILEIEVEGRISLKGPQTIYIDVGQAIDLDKYYKNYAQGKHPMLNEVTSAIAGEIMSMLKQLKLKQHPLESEPKVSL